MSQTHLTRHWIRPSANEGYARNRMMRRTERTLGYQTRLGTQSCHRMNLGSFEGFAERERWQDGGQTLSHHRLSRAWRTYHNHIVATSCSYGKSSFHHFLPLHVLEIVRIGSLGFFEHFPCVHLLTLHLGFACHEAHNVAECVSAEHVQVVDHGGLARIFTWNDNSLKMHLTCQNGKWQAALDGLDGTIERQLSHHHVVFELVGRNLPVGRHYGHGNGHIVERAFLTHVGRGQVNGDSTSRETHSRLAQSTLDAIATFLDSSVRQSDHNGTNTLRCHRLTKDGCGIDALQGSCDCSNDHDLL